MGDEHSADILPYVSRGTQARRDPMHGDSRVDQQRAAAAREQQAVAAGTAGKDRYLHQLIARIFSEPSGSSGKFTISMSAPRDWSLPTKFS